MLRWAIALVLVSQATAVAQEKDASLLTLDRIFASGEFGSPGFSTEWAKDSTFTKMSPSKDGRGRDIVRVDPETGKETILVPSAHLVPPNGSGPLNVEDFTFSNDESKVLIFTESRRVWRVNSRGDFWVLDRTSRELRKLGGDAPASSLMNAKFSPDGKYVAYVSRNRIYVEDFTDAKPRLIGSPTRDDVINGTFDWVYEEEFGIRDGIRWSPDSRSIAYWQLDASGVPDFPLVNNTDSLYPKITWIKYPKVGQKNASARVGVAPIDGSSDTKWVDLPGDPRENYIAFMEWRPGPDRGRLLIQQLNRRQNKVTVWRADFAQPNRVAAAKASNAAGIAAEIVHTETDDAWLDLQSDLTEVGEGRFLWLSDADKKWRDLVVVDTIKGRVIPLTDGDFDVMEITGVDKQNGYVYFDASPGDATRRYLYRAKLDGSTPKGERITPKDQPGTHSYRISPDGRWAVHRYSTFDSPAITDLVKLPSHERVRVLADNQAAKAKLATLKPTKTEFFQIKLDDTTLDAWRIYPSDFDPSKKYPLLVHVYGEPAAQTVVDAWNDRNGLWHRMMAQKGYVVVSIDNRGTPAAKGWAWRKAAFHKIGVLAPKDQAAAVRSILKDSPYLDPKRVGVWGWSGGGSMTLNAMFKYPDLYAVGVSIAPVPNQRYYDTIYQERYMGLPGDNVDGFRDGSPINFAAGLKGKLLLIHGTGDDNCHYQTMELLINELVRLNKPFSMMAYPNRSHSISEGVNTSLHLRSLMTRFFEENLPAGAVR